MNEWSKEDLEEMFGDDIIDQLTFLSGCHQHQLCNANPSGWIISDESLRKFAELIVRECINEIHVADVGDLKGKGYYLDKVAEHIEKHFGVENA